MSATSVPGFKPIPAELLSKPKPLHMTADELVKVLEKLLRHRLIEAYKEPGETRVRFRPTARGLRMLGKHQ